jgi:hypothetical protein
VQYTVRYLERLWFVVRFDRTTRRVHNGGDLLDRWAAGYAEVLRPKLALGALRPTPDLEGVGRTVAPSRPGASTVSI